MSHYSVLVISNHLDLEEILEPYDENADVAPYIEMTKAELQKEFTKEAGDPKPSLEEFVKEWFGGQRQIDERGNLVSTHNRNAKWDWWEVGGRWAGKFILKQGFDYTEDRHLHRHWSLRNLKTDDDKKEFAMYQRMIKERRCDQGTKGSIDWVAMHMALRRDLTEQWERLMSKKDNYHGPEYYIKKYKNLDNYLDIEGGFHTHSVLNDDGWHESGEMGWFGMSSATPEQEAEFGKNFFQRFIEPVSDNTFLTVVDCHI